jgi:hypothetical protein
MSAPAAGAAAAASSSPKLGVRSQELMNAALAATQERERELQFAMLAQVDWAEDEEDDANDEGNFEYDNPEVYDGAMREMGGDPEVYRECDNIRLEFYLLSYARYAQKHAGGGRRLTATDKVFVHWCARTDFCYRVEHGTRPLDDLAERVDALDTKTFDLFVFALNGDAYTGGWADFEVEDIPGLLAGRTRSNVFAVLWPAVRARVSRMTDAEYAAFMARIERDKHNTVAWTNVHCANLAELMSMAKARPAMAERAVIELADLPAGLQASYGLPPELSDIIARFATAGVTDATPLPMRMGRRERLAQLATDAACMSDAEMTNALKRMLADIERNATTSDAKRQKR